MSDALNVLLGQVAAWAADDEFDEEDVCAWCLEPDHTIDDCSTLEEQDAGMDEELEASGEEQG